VVGKALSDVAVNGQLIGHQPAFMIDIERQELVQGFTVNAFGFDRTGLAAALNEGDDWHFVGRAGAATMPTVLGQNPWFNPLFLALADVGLIGFNDLASAAERPEHVGIGSHHQPDAMAHVPGGAQGDAEGAVQLVAADTLFARAHHDDGLQPQVHRYVAIFEDGSDLNREGLTARVTLVEAEDELALGIELAGLGTLVLKFPAAIYDAAMWAHAPVRPNPRLNVVMGDLLVAKRASVENRIWYRLSLQRNI
jgi:hypothetical protein